ncbi:TetR/AcrR family transcriptional regulator [Bacillus massiliigorillae]|uniref:TetR/AcrR family transcriptional regulator n=1 Tax=Bacillus massiliigorillae TaxID=1243664 RepID=UPI0003A8FC94|nr:TetR/AcrR family transcriptional regulator [Bacillus massiliigorillae]
MAKSFTDDEKINIRENLLKACELSWSKYGYKKTNISDLCTSAGISKGAFYMFFQSKEELFCDTLLMVQNKLYQLIEDTLEKSPTKDGVAQALKLIYREYDKSIFLYDSNNVDFIAFTNKLSKEQMNQLKSNSLKGASISIFRPYLQLKIEEDKAKAIIGTLLSTISNKENVHYGHFQVFDFLVDQVIGEIFE